MKINDSHLIEGYRQVAHGQVQRPDKEAKESALQQTRTAADDVDLSSRARQYQKLKKTVMEAPDIRSDKVEDIRARIEAGTYNVRGEQVASGIVKESVVDTLL